jgi:hypothetical protein
MIDAYDIQNKILSAWRSLSITLSGASITRDYPIVLVYVRVGEELHAVSSLQVEDGKIILDID